MNKPRLTPVLLALPLALSSLACPTRTVRPDDAGEPTTGGVGGSATGARGSAGVGGVAGIGGTVGTAGSVGAAGGERNDAGHADALAGDASAVDSRSVVSPGTTLWARSASSVFLYGVAEGSSGVVVSGALSGPANLGGSLLNPLGATDVAIAEYGTSDGAHLFSTRFGGGLPSGTGIVYGHMDVLDSSGAPIIEGTSKCDPTGSPICNEVDVGLGLLSPGGGANSDGFVGRYSVSTGQPTWVDRLIGLGDDFIAVSARGPNDTIFTAGWFNQSTSLVVGKSSQTAQEFAGAGDRDIFISQLSDVSGAVNLTKTFADSAFEQPTGIAWTGTNIIVSGFFSGSMTAFGGPLNSSDFDIWVAKLMPDGTPVWAIALGGPGPDKYPYLATDSAGDIYIAGTVSGSAMFGSYSIGGLGGLDVFVAKVRNSDGGVVWAKSFGSTGDDTAADIAVNDAGQIIVSANVAGAIVAGGPSFGDGDAALVSYNNDGSRLWSKVIGTSGTDGGSGVAASFDGAFYAEVNLGANIGPNVDGVGILGASNPTGLLLKIAP
jgi:hypothetical protein